MCRVLPNDVLLRSQWHSGSFKTVIINNKSLLYVKRLSDGAIGNGTFPVIGAALEGQCDSHSSIIWQTALDATRVQW